MIHTFRWNGTLTHVIQKHSISYENVQCPYSQHNTLKVENGIFFLLISFSPNKTYDFSINSFGHLRAVCISFIFILFWLFFSSKTFEVTRSIWSFVSVAMVKKNRECFEHFFFISLFNDMIVVPKINEVIWTNVNVVEMPISDFIQMLRIFFFHFFFSSL